MENNRTLLISMAGTRKTKHWPRTEITWAEFAEKLKTPVRSTESLEEYLSFAKVKQDELKDVGGFVGGVFAGGGSTIGGAIVYDGDLFLYSHHM